jgi:hypothetical protein
VNIKNCPFCDGKAFIVKSFRYPKYEPYNGDKTEAFSVVCRNSECILYNLDDRYRFSEKESLDAWNRRADLRVDASEAAHAERTKH